MLDKKLFDTEYQTQWRAEVDFLKSIGIRYEFVKRDNGISTYKYKKTSELFRQLAYFYANAKEINRREYYAKENARKVYASNEESQSRY